MQHWILALWVWAGVAGSGGVMSVWSQEPAEVPEIGGKWAAPDQTKPTWNHQETHLRFPVRFSDYTMRGVMDFEGSPGEHLIRYENAALGTRGDVFLSKLERVPKGPEEMREAIKEVLLDAVDDLLAMSEAGRYGEVEDEGSMEGKVEVWEADSIPLLVQQLAAPRIDTKDGKEAKVPLKLWFGGTVFEGNGILIRHTRPAAAGEKGEADMKAFAEAMLRVLKDPSLRAHVRPAMEAFVKDPLTESGQEAAKIVLGYLDNSPMVPVLLPQPPLTQWAEEMEQIVPNSGSQMLRAYVISGALAALDDKDNRSCLTLACQQVVRVYLEVQRLKPIIRHPGLEEMTKAVERGEVAAWFEKQLAEAAAKEAKK